MPCNEEYQLELFKTLRDEILQSIDLQSKIVLGGAVAASVILGLGLSGGTTFRVLLMATPPLLIILVCLWLIEESRMMRAGEFMQFLEDKINLEKGQVVISWENWLRRPVTSRLDIHKIHHYAQYIGILGFFYGVGIVSSMMIWIEKNEWGISVLVAEILITLYLILFVIIFPLIIKIVSHRGKKADKIEFKKWEKSYWESLLETSPR